MDELEKKVEAAENGRYIPVWAGELVTMFISDYTEMCCQKRGCQACPMLQKRCACFDDDFDIEAAYKALKEI